MFCIVSGHPIGPEIAHLFHDFQETHTHTHTQGRFSWGGGVMPAAMGSSRVRDQTCSPQRWSRLLQWQCCIHNPLCCKRTPLGSTFLVVVIKATEEILFEINTPFISLTKKFLWFKNECLLIWKQILEPVSSSP